MKTLVAPREENLGTYWSLEELEGDLFCPLYLFMLLEFLNCRCKLNFLMKEILILSVVWVRREPSTFPKTYEKVQPSSSSKQEQKPKTKQPLPPPRPPQEAKAQKSFSWIMLFSPRMFSSLNKDAGKERLGQGKQSG